MNLFRNLLNFVVKQNVPLKWLGLSLDIPEIPYLNISPYTCYNNLLAVFMSPSRMYNLFACSKNINGTLLCIKSKKRS